MPPNEREKYLRHEGGGNFEHVDLPASAAEVRAARPLPLIPLVVLTAPHNQQLADAQMDRARFEMQADLARLVPNSKHIIVEGSGHFIHLHRPEMVIDAIRTVVEATR